MKPLEYVLSNEKEVLGFLKTKYPMYHLSNVFFRDLHYGIRTMFERRGDKVSYPDGEKIATAFAEKMEKEKIFNRIDQQSWVLNYPEYKKPVVTPAAAAKPAPGAVPAKSPVATGAKPALPPLGSAKPAGATPAAAKPTLPPLSSSKPTDGARPSLPPLSSAKPVAGATPALPPLAGAKPVGAAKPVDGTKPALPPLTGAKPVGGAKPALPPLASATPVAAKPAESVQATPTPKVEEQRVVQAKVEAPDVEMVKPEATSSAVPVALPGQRKPLPPLKGNYTPAGKK